MEKQLQSEIEFQCVYMGDRLAVTKSALTAIRARRLWSEFASRLHLLENEDKAQFVSVHGSCVVEGSRFASWCEHLGACSLSQWRAFQKHQRRMDKSHFVSFKVGLLPVVVQQKIKDVRAFALSRFSFKWCQGVGAKIWKAIGRFQFSIGELKQISVGGPWEPFKAVHGDWSDFGTGRLQPWMEKSLLDCVVWAGFLTMSDGLIPCFPVGVHFA